MNRLRRFRGMLALFLAVFLSPGYAREDSGAGSRRAAAAQGQAESVELVDATLADQEGRPVRFASEAVGDRIVAINFIYTTCTTVCPLASAIFKHVQDKLGERLGRDVRLISVSLDPATDTPARLKDSAARYQAKPGWIWLTGNRPDVERVLNGLGASSANFREHPPMVVVGDGRHGGWSRFYALPGPDRILASVETLLKARNQNGASP